MRSSSFALFLFVFLFLIAACVPQETGPASEEAGGGGLGDELIRTGVIFDDPSDPGDDGDPGDEPEPGDDDEEPPAGPAWHPIYSGVGDPLLGSIHVDVGPDGSLYVIWVDDTEEGTDAWLARSTDAGVTWEAPVRVDDDSMDPRVAWANQPFVLATEEAVHVTMMAGSDPMQVYLVSAPLGESLQFGEPLHVAADAPGNHRPAYARAALGPDGEIWVGYNLSIRLSQWSWEHKMAFARESEGFAATLVALDDPPCDCCPSSLMATAGGDMLLGYRNQTEVGREVKVAISPQGATDFSEAYPVSGEPWDEDVCPNQGPWLAEMSDGTLLVATADASQGNRMAWISRSSDGGETWGPETAMSPPGTMPARPTIAVDTDDRLWVTYQTTIFDSVILASDDGGVTFSEEQALVSPVGPLASAVVTSRDGLTVVVGITMDGGIWMFRP